MKSKILIDIDEDNQPIIKIEYEASEDVKDKLVKRFLESFGFMSCWARLNYKDRGYDYRTQCAILKPIPDRLMPEELRDMGNSIESIEKTLPETPQF